MTTAQGPFTSTDFNLADLAEHWIADRKLSEDAIEWLRGEFNELTSTGGWLPMIAPGHYCSELELPQGSTWPEVLASLLDACLNFREGVQPLTHLQTIREYLPTEEA